MALVHVSPMRVLLLGAATMRNPSELVSCGRRVCDRIASHALDVPLPFVSCLRFRLDSETGVYNKLDTRAVVGVDRPSGLTLTRQSASPPVPVPVPVPVLHCAGPPPRPTGVSSVKLLLS